MNNTEPQIGIAYVGTTRGLQYQGSQFCQEQDINEFKVMLAKLEEDYYPIIPMRDYWIVLSQKDNQENTLTLYALYRYAIEKEESREGGYYGAVVLIKNAVLNAEKVIFYLNSLVTEIKKNALDSNDKFFRDLDTLVPLKEVSPSLDAFYPAKIGENIIEYCIEPFDKSLLGNFILGANNIIRVANSPKIVFIASEGKGQIEVKKHINIVNIPQLKVEGEKLLIKAQKEEANRQLKEEHKKNKNGGGGTIIPPTTKTEIDITSPTFPKTTAELEKFILKVIKQNPEAIIEIGQKQASFSYSDGEKHEEETAAQGTAELDYDDSRTWKPFFKKQWQKWGKLAGILALTFGCLYFFVLPYISFDFLTTQPSIEIKKDTPPQKPSTSSGVVETIPENRTTCDCFPNKATDKGVVKIQYYNKTEGMTIGNLANKLQNICSTCGTDCSQEFENHVKTKNPNDAATGLLKKDKLIDMFFKENCTSVRTSKAFEDDGNGGLKEYSPPPKVTPTPKLSQTPKAVTTKPPTVPPPKKTTESPGWYTKNPQ